MVATPSALRPARPTLGTVFFRYRSYTLIPLAVLLLLAPWLVRPAAAFEAGWLRTLGGALVAVAAAVRFHVSGCSPRGTSTRGKTIGAAQLITGGCYSRTRNPLYLANACVWVGATVLTGHPILLPFVIAILAVQYWLIIRAEEQFLRGKFGVAYAAYSRQVPRFFPRLRAWRGAQKTLPFGWKRAIFKEHDSLYVSAAVVALLLTPVVLRAGGSPTAVAGWFVSIAGLTVVWLAVKVLKRRAGRSSRVVAERLRPFVHRISAAVASESGVRS